ncbi:MAG: MNIO family bufferin maturase [Thermoanaerobaculia bacterium]
MTSFRGNRWGFPDLGLGVGLRTVHYPHILEAKPEVDFFEILSENYMDTGGRPSWVLDQVAERYTIVMHGVSLSIGSVDPLNFDHLAKLKKLAARTKALWVSDHLCWTGVAGRNTHDLLPMPLSEEALAHVVARVKTVSDFLERPLILENASTYAEFTTSSMTEWDFFARLMDEADCGMLLDVNNVYVSSYNHGFDPIAYLDAVPPERVVQYHLAGHTNKGTHIIDTHNDYVIDEVWKLYAHSVKRTGNVSTLLEWDADIPEFEIVHAEALKARAYRDERAGQLRVAKSA